MLYSGKGYLICPVKSQVSSVFEVYWLYLAVQGTKDVNYRYENFLKFTHSDQVRLIERFRKLNVSVCTSTLN